MHKYIRGRFTEEKEIKHHITIGLADILSGEFTSFEEREDHEEMMRILEASTTFSGISPAIEMMDSYYFSGNAIYENDVVAAINHCVELGYKEEDIIIDSILGGRAEVETWEGKNKNAFQVMERTAELWDYYLGMHGILRSKAGHSDVNFRYVVGPTYLP